MTNERRQVTRYMTILDIDIILDGGSILAATTTNISTHGLEFKCDGFIANEIEPRGIQNHPLDHIKIKVVSTLPMDDEQKLYAICKIISARRLSQEEYMLGLEFIDFENNSDKVLQRYVGQLASEALA